MLIKRNLLRSVSAISLSCAVFGGAWTAAQAQGDTGYRWGPRGEIGGYAGDSALTRGEVGLFFPLYQDGTQLAFGDLRGRFFEGGAEEGNLALGYRRQMANGRIFGGWIGYDVRKSFTGNNFDQLSGGIEVLDPNWEFRLNGYLPLTDKRAVSSTTTVTGGGTGTGAPSLSLVGSQLFLTSGTGVTTTRTVNELAMYGVDVEFGVRVPLGGNAAVSRNATRGGLPKHDLRLYGGAYYFDHDDFAGEIAGLRARAEWRINDVFREMPGSFAAFDVAYQYDDVRDGLFSAGFRLNVPLSRKRAPVQPDQYDALMTGFIQRDPNIVTELATATSTTGSTIISEPVEDFLTGTSLDQTIFVDPGDDLQAEIDGAGPNSHIVVTGGTFAGSFTLPDDVTFQGAGTDLTVAGQTTGTTAVFSQAGTTPVLSFPPTVVTQTPAVAAIAPGSPNLQIGPNTHVLGFDIVGGSTTTGPTEATRVSAIAGPGNKGIEGRANASNVVIRDVDIRDTGGTGIDLSAGSNRATILDVNIDGARGDGIALGLNNSTVSLTNVTIGDSFGDGVTITGTPGDSSTVNFSGVSVDRSGDTGIDIMNAGGAFTFINTDITGSGNQGLFIAGGDAGIFFDADSSIIHDSDGAALNVNGGTPNTGILTFDGLIDTTAGLGLQFDNADGFYDFSGQVTLNGGDAGIDIIGGSAGTFTFANTDITDPTGTAFNVDGGSADVTYSGGSITQGNDATTVNVQGGHTGQLNFGIDITATNGDGLQFDNADGTYNFNTMSGTTTLNGGDAGIDIIGGSNGTFTFGNTDITDPTGTAFNVNTTGAIVNYSGGSISQNNDQALVDLSGSSNSSFTFGTLTTLNATNGTGIQLNNVSGSVATFDGPVTLNGGDAGIDITNTSTSAFEFSNTSITDPTGTAFNLMNVEDSAISVTGPITQNNAATAVMIDGFDSSVINFGSPIVANTGAADGVSLTDITASVISILGFDIDTTTGTGLLATGLDDSSLIVGQSSVDTTNGQAMNVSAANGTDVTMQLTSVSSQNSPTSGIRFDNVDPATIVAQTVDIGNSTGAGIEIINTTGTFAFSDVTITDPGGTAIDIMGGTASVTVGGGTISQSNNATTVGVTNHTGGTVTIGAAINATNGDGLQFNNADGTYTFDPAGTDTIVLDGTGNAADTGIDILGGSAGTFTFSGTVADPIQITNDQGVAVNVADSPGTVNLNDVTVNQSNGAGIQAANSGTLDIFGGIINNTNGDAINVTNTNLRVDSTLIGETGPILGDGIEIQNTDGVDRTADLIFNNIFGLGSPDPTGRGIFINALSGTLTADLSANFISTDQSTIQTRDGGSAPNLILSMTGNSTLTTNGAFPTMDITGSGLNSTIVREWEFPNQVIGSITTSSGILFDRVTFDADGNPTNGFQQVVFDDGALDIGQVPPFTIQRVEGNGLTFLDTTGDLRIETLNIANQNGTGLLVDTKGLGTTFNLDIGGGTIDTIGGPAVFLDPLTGDITLDALNAPGGLIFDEFIGTFNVSDGSIALNTGGTLALDGAPDVTIMNMGFAGADGMDGGPGVDGTNGETAITVNNSTLTLDNVTAIGGKGGSGGDATGANDAGDAGLAGDGIRIDANSTVNVTNGSQITGGDAGDGGNSDTGTPGSVLFNAAGNGIFGVNGGNTINVTDSTVAGGTSGVLGLNAAGEYDFFGPSGSSTLGGEGIELDDDATLQIVNSTISGGAARNTTGFTSISSGGDGIFVPNGVDSGGVDPTNVFNITIDNSTVSAGPGVAGTATLNAGIGGPTAIDIFESNLTLNIINNSMILGADGVVDPRRSDPGFASGLLPSDRNAVPGTTALGTFAAGTINIIDSTVRGGTGGDATATVGAGDGEAAIAILELSDTPGPLTVNITDSTIQGGDAGDGGQDMIERILGTLEPADGGGEAIVAFSGTNAQVFNINNSTIQGGNGSTQTGIYGPTMGGSGFETREGDTTTVNVNAGTTITAGDGGDGTGANDGADGGIGVRIAGGTVNFNAGSTTTGGDGGDATGTGDGGDGGLAVDASASFSSGAGTVNNTGGTLVNGTNGTP